MFALFQWHITQPNSKQFINKSTSIDSLKHPLKNPRILQQCFSPYASFHSISTKLSNVAQE